MHGNSLLPNGIDRWDVLLKSIHMLWDVGESIFAHLTLGQTGQKIFAIFLNPIRADDADDFERRNHRVLENMNTG